VKFLKSMPKDKLQKLVLTVIVSLIAIGAVVNFYVLKQIDQLSGKKEEVNNLNKKITEVQDEMKAEVGNTELREQIREFLRTQERRMVQGDAFSWIVREMALLAEEHPVRVASLNPIGKSTYEPKPQYELYGVRLEVTGTYDQLGRFVSDLENSFPSGTIRALGMTVADVSKGECRINIDMTLLMRPKSDLDSALSDKAETEKKTSA